MIRSARFGPIPVTSRRRLGSCWIGHVAAAITTAGEKKLARFLASDFDLIVNGLPRLLRQFKPDGPTGFLLPNNREPQRC
jgi:hypothetical protein